MTGEDEEEEKEGACVLPVAWRAWNWVSPRWNHSIAATSRRSSAAAAAATDDIDDIDDIDDEFEEEVEDIKDEDAAIDALASPPPLDEGTCDEDEFGERDADFPGV